MFCEQVKLQPVDSGARAGAAEQAQITAELVREQADGSRACDGPRLHVADLGAGDLKTLGAIP
jgi:hypothetical protein